MVTSSILFDTTRAIYRNFSRLCPWHYAIVPALVKSTWEILVKWTRTKPRRNTIKCERFIFIYLFIYLFILFIYLLSILFHFVWVCVLWGVGVGCGVGGEGVGVGGVFERAILFHFVWVCVGGGGAVFERVFSSISYFQIRNARWWRHIVKTFIALLALYEGDPSGLGGFSSQSSQRAWMYASTSGGSCRWLETPWRSRDATLMDVARYMLYLLSRVTWGQSQSMRDYVTYNLLSQVKLGRPKRIRDGVNDVTHLYGFFHWLS